MYQNYWNGSLGLEIKEYTDYWPPLVQHGLAILFLANIFLISSYFLFVQRSLMYFQSLLNLHLFETFHTFSFGELAYGLI